MFENYLMLTGIPLNSSTVIMARTFGMMGLKEQDDTEYLTMFFEKIEAFQESAINGMLSGMRGDVPDKILRQTLLPYDRRTKANAKRLSSRNP